MPTRLDISRAEFTFEAAFHRPQFGLFRDAMIPIRSVYERLEHYGLRLGDIKMERGTGTLGEFHLFYQLFNYGMTGRIRLDRADFGCINVTDDSVKTYSAAIIDTLTAVDELVGGYRTYSLTLNLHGLLDGQEIRDFLGRFVAVVPEVGPSTGSGVGYYYGSSEDRIVASLTLDLSTVLPGGLFVRSQATWDATKINYADMPARAEGFVRKSIEAAGLALAPVP